MCMFNISDSLSILNIYIRIFFRNYKRHSKPMYKARRAFTLAMLCMNWVDIILWTDDWERHFLSSHMCDSSGILLRGHICFSVEGTYMLFCGGDIPDFLWRGHTCFSVAAVHFPVSGLLRIMVYVMVLSWLPPGSTFQGVDTTSNHRKHKMS